MNYKIYLILLFLSLFYSFNEIFSQIRINEVCSSNYNSLYDEDKDTPDWIELLNYSDFNVNLNNYKIYDKNDLSDAWILPDIILKPGEYKILFASGKSRNYSDNIHIKSNGTGFELERNKDVGDFYYIPVKDDFDATLDISSCNTNDYRSQIGLILRDSLSQNSKYIGLMTYNFIRKEIRFYEREETGIDTKFKFYFPTPSYPNMKIQLIKRGNILEFNYLDKENYSWKRHIDTINYKGENYIGIAVSSGSDEEFTQYFVNEFKIDGKVKKAETFNKISYGVHKKGNMANSQEIHTNFKLNRESDSLYLWNDKDLLIDNIGIPVLNSDISFGWFDDSVFYFDETTPEDANFNPKIGILEKVKFMKGKHIFDSLRTILLISDDDAEIYYTLDGSLPDTTDQKYTMPLTFSKNTVINTKAFKKGYITSVNSFNHFYKSQNFSLPILSYTVDSTDLYKKGIGIFSQEYDKLENKVEGYFQLIDTDGHAKYKSGADFKRHGRGSQVIPQRSVRAYANNKYGNSDFIHTLFGNTDIRYHNKLIFKNSGQDWKSLFLRSCLASELMSEITDIDYVDYKQVLGFLNGKFYGLYNIRERFDSDFLAKRYNLNKNDFNVLEENSLIQEDIKLEIKSGSRQEFIDLLPLIENINEDNNYEKLKQDVDTESLIDFLIMNLYANNVDWPHANVIYYNSKKEKIKWKWLSYDFDMAFALPKTAYVRNVFKVFEKSNTFFSNMTLNLLKNIEFKNEFIVRSCDLQNTSLIDTTIIKKLEKIANNIRPYIELQNERWEKSVRNWDDDLNLLKDWIETRAGEYKWQKADYFNLNQEFISITIDNNIIGDDKNNHKIKFNSLIIDEFPWTGLYPKNIPLNISIIDSLNKFYKYTYSLNSEKSKVQFIASDDMNIRIIYNENATNNDSNNIVINEIMYKSSEENETEDWIEIINISDEVVDLSGWKFVDDLDEEDEDKIFIFPNNIMLHPNKFLILCRDLEKFKENNNVSESQGDFNFGLSKDGDDLFILNDLNVIVDSVNYLTISPWPLPPLDLGHTLSLNNPTLDNNNPTNWSYSLQEGGNPGYYNFENSLETDNIIFNVYPNPTSSIQNIELSFQKNNNISIKIIDINGEIVRNLFNGIINSDKILLYWNGKNENKEKCMPGVYFYLVETENIIYLKKTILLQ